MTPSATRVARLLIASALSIAASAADPPPGREVTITEFDIGGYHYKQVHVTQNGTSMSLTGPVREALDLTRTFKYAFTDDGDVGPLASQVLQRSETSTNLGTGVVDAKLRNTSLVHHLEDPRLPDDTFSSHRDTTTFPALAGPREVFVISASDVEMHQDHGDGTVDTYKQHAHETVNYQLSPGGATLPVADAVRATVTITDAGGNVLTGISHIRVERWEVVGGVSRLQSFHSSSIPLPNGAAATLDGTRRGKWRVNGNAASEEAARAFFPQVGAYENAAVSIPDQYDSLVGPSLLLFTFPEFG